MRITTRDAADAIALDVAACSHHDTNADDIP
jgi:hypothetical protein